MLIFADHEEDFSVVMKRPKIEVAQIDRSLLEKLVYLKIAEFFHFNNPHRGETEKIKKVVNKIKNNQECMCKRICDLERLTGKLKTRTVGVQVDMPRLTSQRKRMTRSKSETPALRN